MLSIRIARRTFTAALSIAAALAITAAARAEPLPPFGRAGQVVLDDLIGLRTGAPGYLGQLASGVGAATGVAINALGYSGVLGYGHFTTSSTNPYTPSFASNGIWAAPAVDVFVAPRLSVGAALGASYAWQTASEPPNNTNTPVVGVPAMTAWSLSAIPRVGYVWPIAHRLALWPRIGLGYAYARSEQRYGTSYAYASASSTWLGGIEMKLVYQATRHVFFDVAPYLSARHVTALGTDRTRSFMVNVGGTVGMGVVL